MFELLELADCTVLGNSGSPALEGITLSHSQGILTLLGPTGAGKSTLLKVLATYLLPEGGEVRIFGQDVRQEALNVRRHIGYVPQDIALPEDLTLEEYLVELALLDKPASEAFDRAYAAMVAVNLHPMAGQALKTLSGGMKRRALLAQALMRDLRLLLVDTPTAGLDPYEQMTILELLRTVAETTPVVAVTQVAEEIPALPGRLAVLYRGRLIWQGSSQALAELARGRLYELPWSFRDRVPGPTLPGAHPGVMLALADEAPHQVAKPVEPLPHHGYLYLMGQHRMEVCS